jgi:hypothetical protein
MHRTLPICLSPLYKNPTLRFQRFPAGKLGHDWRCYQKLRIEQGLFQKELVEGISVDEMTIVN